MDGLFHGKHYFLMDDLGVPLILDSERNDGQGRGEKNSTINGEMAFV